MENEIKYLIDSDVDNLCFKLECAVQNLNTIHDAMTHEGWTLDFYTPAVYASYLFLYDLISKLRQMIQDAQAVTVPVKEVSE